LSSAKTGEIAHVWPELREVQGVDCPTGAPMQIQQTDVYFIERDALEQALEKGVAPRPMFSIDGAGAEVPAPGDKVVFEDFSYRVVGRTFAYADARLKIVVTLEF
jgi:hypothetical protein